MAGCCTNIHFQQYYIRLGIWFILHYGALDWPELRQHKPWEYIYYLHPSAVKSRFKKLTSRVDDGNVKKVRRKKPFTLEKCKGLWHRSGSTTYWENSQEVTLLPFGASREHLCALEWPCALPSFSFLALTPLICLCLLMILFTSHLGASTSTT